jgi:hypothetical protein
MNTEDTAAASSTVRLRRHLREPSAKDVWTQLTIDFPEVGSALHDCLQEAVKAQPHHRDFWIIRIAQVLALELPGSDQLDFDFPDSMQRAGEVISVVVHGATLHHYAPLLGLVDDAVLVNVRWPIDTFRLLCRVVPPVFFIPEMVSEMIRECASGAIPLDYLGVLHQEYAWSMSWSSLCGEVALAQITSDQRRSKAVVQLVQQWLWDVLPDNKTEDVWRSWCMSMWTMVDATCILRIQQAPKRVLPRKLCAAPVLCLDVHCKLRHHRYLCDLGTKLLVMDSTTTH